MVRRVALNAFCADDVRLVLSSQHRQLLVVQVRNTFHLAVVKLLRVPGLLVVSAHCIEELRETFVVSRVSDAELIDLASAALLNRDDHFLVDELVGESSGKPEEEDAEAKGGLVHLSGPQWVVRITGSVVEGLFSWDRIKDLSVADSPVAHHEHQVRRALQQIKGAFAETLIEHWRLAIQPDETDLLGQVRVEETQEADREHERDEHAVHESDVDHVNHGGVFVVHQVLGTAVRGNVRLNGGQGRLVLDLNSFVLVFIGMVLIEDVLSCGDGPLVQNLLHFPRAVGGA